MKKQELILISILTVIIAVMDITGIPSAFFINIHIADIEPIYFTLMVNFLIIGIIAFLLIKYLCPEWRLGFTANGLTGGLKRYGIIGVITAVIGFVAFYVGLKPFDRQPSIAKVLVEGVIYYIGVAIIEELYVRGLLLNLIERFFYKKQNSVLIAVVLSSAIFGLGHIFGTLGQSLLTIISKVIWTIGMGMFFGMIYKKTDNLWLPIIIHFLINVCALPYCFSSLNGYADLTLYIIMPVYILLGIYSLIELKTKEE
ncbi:MAG: CPBP family intramembrane metalloprotease [Oscillospiraceae bacterium]|nr:CPBP family intramembrane metalloprotease [Oscillospiraceae bacterium]